MDRGTCAFLVGLGFVEDDSFVVRQLFMRDHGEEAAMLAALGELLERFDILVSYNGKTYDIPLLETRFILCRDSAARSRRSSTSISSTPHAACGRRGSSVAG